MMGKYNRLLTWKDIPRGRKILEEEQWIEKGFIHNEFWKKDAAMLKWVTILEEFKYIGKNGLKVVELGSASGVTPHIIGSWGNDVTAIDINTVDNWCPKGFAKMIIGDALYELKQMDSSSVDVIIDSCSVHCFNPSWKDDIKNIGWKDIAEESYRVLKPNGRIISSTDVKLSYDYCGEFISPSSLIDIIESSGLVLTSDYKEKYEHVDMYPYRQIENELYVFTAVFKKPEIKIISHRGNIDGENSDRENSISYVEEAISAGYDVEVDLWVKEGEFYLGHDFPQHIVYIDWLLKNKDYLWIHCKNLEALESISHFADKFNYFWHSNDSYTLTSKGIGWVLLGQTPYSNSIIVLPEKIDYYTKYNGKYDRILKTKGICTDNCNYYRQELKLWNGKKT